jgi:hypothetical protein
MASRLELTREQILAFRRRVGALDERTRLSLLPGLDLWEEPAARAAAGAEAASLPRPGIDRAIEVVWNG